MSSISEIWLVEDTAEIINGGYGKALFVEQISRLCLVSLRGKVVRSYDCRSQSVKRVTL